MKDHDVCPKCGGPTIMVEYGYGSKYRYDGVSEIMCRRTPCDWRIGRWCEQELTKGEVEPPFCEGKKTHPRVFTINE